MFSGANNSWVSRPMISQTPVVGRSRSERRAQPHEAAHRAPPQLYLLFDSAAWLAPLRKELADLRVPVQEWNLCDLAIDITGERTTDL